MGRETLLDPRTRWLRQPRLAVLLRNKRVKFIEVILIPLVSGLQELSLISKHDLFLCDSGDEIRSIGERCNSRPVCEDRSDERDCNQCE